MPRVRFTEDFDWRPRPGVILAFPAGWEGPVTRRCAERATAQRKAERVQRPRKEREEGNGES